MNAPTTASPSVTIQEIPLRPHSGWGRLWVGLALVASPLLIVPGAIGGGVPFAMPFVVVPAVLAGVLALAGLMAVAPNEARVCSLLPGGHYSACRSCQR